MHKQLEKDPVCMRLRAFRVPAMKGKKTANANANTNCDDIANIANISPVITNDHQNTMHKWCHGVTYSNWGARWFLFLSGLLDGSFPDTIRSRA